MSSIAVAADEREREADPDPKGSERCHGALQGLVDPAQEHWGQRGTPSQFCSQPEPRSTTRELRFGKPIPLLLFFGWHRQAARWYAQMDI